MFPVSRGFEHLKCTRTSSIGAAEAFGTALAARLGSQGERHPNTIATLSALAVVEARRGRLDAAHQPLGRALSRPDAAPGTMISMGSKTSGEKRSTADVAGGEE